MDKKLLYNTFASLLYQLVAIICGFILPRCFLVVYGSEVNGLVASITQFLSFISLMDLGISAVVKASLYRPLEEKNNQLISSIMVSAKRFYSKIITIFILYIVVLCFLFPFAINSSFDIFFTITLIIAMSVNLIGQYYFGIVNQTIIDADQKLYINSILQIATLVLNTVISVVLMLNFGASIQAVKLVSSLIFLARPLYLLYYVKKHYHIDYSVTYDEEPIKQKWNGIYQHIASVILNNTDVVVLTFFSTLTNVSIYNVYSLVVSGVKNIVISITSGIQSKMGHMMASGKYLELNTFFDKMELVMHTVTTFFFTATAILIIPFMEVYTNGIDDANYILPIFGLLMTLSQMSYCIRLPYSQLVLASGQFKETQNSAILEVIINIVLSVALVRYFGLYGVAIGTIIAMIFRTFYYVIYISRNILSRPIKIFIKNLLADLIIFIASCFICSFISMDSIGYVSWGLLSIKCCLIIALLCLVTQLTLNYKIMAKIYKRS